MCVSGLSAAAGTASCCWSLLALIVGTGLCSYVRYSQRKGVAKIRQLKYLISKATQTKKAEGSSGLVVCYTSDWLLWRCV